MRALWLEDQKLALRDDLPRPAPPSGEALVRVLLAGICNTDLELTGGYYPFAGIPGHEFVGEWEGRRVVGEINAACHSCEACGQGRVTHCENRTVLGIKSRNGAFAEYLALPMENLHRLPDEINTEEAVFVEPLAAALQIQEQVSITSDDRVLVVGEGKLGQLVARTLALTGCELLVIGKHARKRSLLEAIGIKTAETVPAAKFDVAIDCTGNTTGFAIARQALRPRGTLVMKSTYAGEMTINASSLVVDEITLVGSRCGPFQKAIDVLANRKIAVKDLVEATYPINQAITAFGHARRSGALKVLVKCGD